ncbi:MAG TPA: head GIN domain-containing protein [Chitinophagaceae bacterium]|nr:head GIN domain-containing protein [Chitinophagaceae bacterium]HPH33742.1 head GIN domain-containing protein [Chitinophagaceae bacterium]HPN59663.1 head GIN domain-containing protein [Chitinophagaceae bacterium]
MKKLCLSLLFLTGFASYLGAQQTINDPNAVKVDVASFHGIEVATGIELFLNAGNVEEVAISASNKEYRDRIVARVENGILKIYYESKLKSINKKKESKQLKAYVSYKQLDELQANTGALVRFQGVLKTVALDMKVNTGAQVMGEVDIKSLVVKQNTGSQVSLTGKTEQLKVDGDTGSKFKGEEMTTQSCDVTVSTGANVTIDAEKEIMVKASTGGIVKYKGNAAIREIKTSTGGTVKKIG